MSEQEQMESQSNELSTAVTKLEFDDLECSDQIDYLYHQLEKLTSRFETFEQIANTRDIKFQPLWKHDPSTWFDVLEAQFIRRAISSDEDKTWNLLMNLGADIVPNISGALKDAPSGMKYATIKTAVLSRHIEIKTRKLEKILNKLEIGNKKPSQTYHEIVGLAGDEFTSTDILTVWKQKLTSDILFFIGDKVTSDNEDVILERADRLHDLYHNRNQQSLPKSAYANEFI